MLFAATRIILLSLILLTSLWLRLTNFSQIPPVLLQKELKIALAAQVINDSNTSEAFSLFSRNFSFINTQFIAPFPILFTAPFIKAFGFTPFAIRLPSVIAAVATIILFYLVAWKTYPLISKNIKSSKIKDFFPLIAAFFFALSPWHIQVSRIDTGVNLGLFFFLLGVFLSIKLAKSKRLVLFSALPYSAAIYSDYLFFIPSLVVLFATIILSSRNHFSPSLYSSSKARSSQLSASNNKYLKSFDILISFKHYIFRLTLLIFLALFLLIPILTRIYSYEAQIDFVNYEFFASNAQKANARIASSGDSLKSKILNDPSIENAKFYLKNVTDYLEPASLFVRWDYNTGFITKNSGLLNPLELIFLIAGSIFLLKNNRKVLGISTIFIASVVLPQAIQNSRPDAIRIILIFMPVVFVLTLGFISIWNTISSRHRIVFLIAIFLISFYFTLRFAYFFSAASGITTPDYYIDYKDAFEFVDKNAQLGQKIIVTDATYGKDLSLYWIFLTKRENLAKKYIAKKSTATFDNYTFAKVSPKKYKNSAVYIQPLVTIPKYYPAVFSSNSPDKNLRISVLSIPEK